MIVKLFPDPVLTESTRCQVSRNFGKKNIVFNARAHQIEYNQLTSPLSLKYTLRGEEWYDFQGANLLVDPAHFLLVNNQEVYSSCIDSEEEVESFCIFFRKEMIGELHTIREKSLAQLLDDPTRHNEFHLDIIQQRFRADREFCQRVAALKQCSDLPSGDLVAEHHIYHLLDHILGFQIAAKSQIVSLPFQKLSTRLEVYKRIRRVRDYIDSSPGSALDLDTLAKIACLSKYHFLRLFKVVCGLAPHRYISLRRLERAKLLLENGTPVSETCFAVGFSSPCSFSRLFKQHFGMPPSAFTVT